MRQVKTVTDKADTINDRIRIARVVSELSQKEFAARIGTQQNVISEIENGSRRVTANLIQEVGKMGFDLNWLLYGTSDNDAVSELVYSISDNKKILLNIFADLKDLPTKDLLYLQEAIEVYVKHHATAPLPEIKQRKELKK